MLRLNCCLFCALFPQQVLPQVWEFNYLEAEKADQLSACTAGIYYSDGPFVARIYDDVMDFYFGDDELSVPSNKALGTVTFKFSRGEYVLDAFSTDPSLPNGNTTNMFFTPEPGDYEAILNQLRFALNLEIVFPNGLFFTIDLDNSDSALQEAFSCWKERETGAGGENPFSSSDDAGQNPFH